MKNLGLFLFLLLITTMAHGQSTTPEQAPPYPGTPPPAPMSELLLNEIQSWKNEIKARSNDPGVFNYKLHLDMHLKIEAQSNKKSNEAFKTQESLLIQQIKDAKLGNVHCILSDCRLYVNSQDGAKIISFLDKAVTQNNAVKKAITDYSLAYAKYDAWQQQKQRDAQAILDQKKLEEQKRHDAEETLRRADEQVKAEALKKEQGIAFARALKEKQEQEKRDAAELLRAAGEDIKNILGTWYFKAENDDISDYQKTNYAEKLDYSKTSKVIFIDVEDDKKSISIQRCNYHVFWESKGNLCVPTNVRDLDPRIFVYNPKNRDFCPSEAKDQERHVSEDEQEDKNCFKADPKKPGTLIYESKFPGILEHVDAKTAGPKVNPTYSLTSAQIKGFQKSIAGNWLPKKLASDTDSTSKYVVSIKAWNPGQIEVQWCNANVWANTDGKRCASEDTDYYFYFPLYKGFCETPRDGKRYQFCPSGLKIRGNQLVESIDPLGFEGEKNSGSTIGTYQK